MFKIRTRAAMLPNCHLLPLVITFFSVGAEKSIGFEQTGEISERSFVGNVTRNLTTRSLTDCAYACVQQDQKSNNCNSFSFGKFR